MKLKSVLAYTNPVTLVIGAPIVVGFIIGAITKNVAYDTIYALKDLADDYMK